MGRARPRQRALLAQRSVDDWCERAPSAAPTNHRPAMAAAPTLAPRRHRCMGTLVAFVYQIPQKTGPTVHLFGPRPASQVMRRAPDLPSLQGYDASAHLQILHQKNYSTEPLGKPS